jgi:hypothetical protein
MPRRVLLALLVLALIAAGVWWFFLQFGRPYTTLPPAFDGSSDQLRHTAILPTLDTPIPDGKSAIWCASFQYAWNHLRDDVAKGPIQLTHAQPVADRLNRADHTEQDVNPESVYAAAGLATDGVVERIWADMARRFPNGPKPELDVPSGGAVAYSYLEASAKFDLPFFNNDDPMPFRDAAGIETPVGSFGIRRKDSYAYHRLRELVRVLYRPKEFAEELTEFVIDPCVTSQPYQVVIARVDRKPTLAETLAEVRKKTVSHPQDEYHTQLSSNDTLLIPNLAFTIRHRFAELEGLDRLFANPPLRETYLATAFQSIRFRLDRSGAELSSESKIHTGPIQRHYIVNRPFLVFLTKRGADRPFFVAWIENAEMLARK